jgi:hypothetical protein
MFVVVVVVGAAIAAGGAARDGRAVARDGDDDAIEPPPPATLPSTPRDDDFLDFFLGKSMRMSDLGSFILPNLFFLFYYYIIIPPRCPYFLFITEPLPQPFWNKTAALRASTMDDRDCAVPTTTWG